MIYPIDNKGRIPLNPDGSNPYDYVILLHNNEHEKGNAKNFTVGLKIKKIAGWNLQLNYGYGKSMTSHDGTASVNVSQWRFLETVNGRNFPALAVSDFSIGHRIFFLAEKNILSADKKRNILITISYTAQSGSPFSYVYGDGSLTRDDGPFGNYDLLYVPTKEEINNMIFLKNSIDGNVYSPNEQREALNLYIESDQYLRIRRGQYAERNGSRTPFTHRVDFSLKQKFHFQLSGNRYQLEFSLEIGNLLNLVNPEWGKQYTVPFDNFSLLSFSGYTGSGNNIPQYRFNPGLVGKNPWTIIYNSIPAYSSGWTAQLGCRIRFY